MPTAFIANQIFTGFEIASDKAVLVENETVTAIVSSSSIPTRYNKKDLGKSLLAPAFIASIPTMILPKLDLLSWPLARPRLIGRGQEPMQHFATLSLLAGPCIKYADEIFLA